MPDILSRLPDHTLLSILCFLTTAFLVHRYYLYVRLSHIPGPFPASLSCIPMLHTSLRGNAAWDFKLLNDKYGPLVRIGPNELLCSDSDTMRRIASVRSKYTRGGFYDAMKFNPVKDNLLSTRDERLHNELKAKTAAGYSGKEVPSLEPQIDAQIHSLITLIERKYLSNETEYKRLDFAKVVQYFTLDVITALAFGNAFGYLDRDEDVHGYIAMTEDNIPVLMALSYLPWLVRILHSRLLRAFVPSERDKLGFGRLIGVAKDVVAKRYAPDARPQADMLGSFISHGLAQEEASSETILQVVAGSDTTATAIRATFLHILTSPLTHTTLLTELSSAITTHKISNPITDTEAKSLPYLQAVILEGLRIFPPVTGTMFKCVPEGGDVILGKPIPAGTQLGISVFGKTHDTSLFGSDASIFRPERWLDPKLKLGDLSQEKRMRGVVDEVFSSGKWTCPGNGVARMELNKVFVELFRRFEFVLERPTEPWSSTCAGIFIQKDMFVRVTRREPAWA